MSVISFTEKKLRTKFFFIFYFRSDPDPLFRIRIRIKMKRILNTAHFEGFVSDVCPGEDYPRDFTDKSIINKEHLS